MNTLFAPFSVMLTVFSHEIVNTEFLVVLSNFAVVIATLVLVGVTVREAHKTVREVVKSDNRLIAKILGPILVKPENGSHKKTKDN